MALRGIKKILKELRGFLVYKNCMFVYLLRENRITSMNWQSLVDRIRIQTEECEFQMDINSGEVKKADESERVASRIYFLKVH